MLKFSRKGNFSGVLKPLPQSVTIVQRSSDWFPLATTNSEGDQLDVKESVVSHASKEGEINRKLEIKPVQF